MEPTHFESLYAEDTRSDEINQILEFVKKGASCQVVGLPGIGKGSLLGLLSYNKQVRIKHLGEHNKWFHFVYMDFSEVKKRPLSDVTKFLLISLSYSLNERGLNQEYDRVNEFIQEAIQFNDELILFQALKKSIDYLSIEKELTVVLMFDRFDQYMPDISEQFFMNLKILRNRAKYRFSVVFSLPRPLEDTLEQDVFFEFYEYLAGNVVYMRLFDPIGLTFRLSYVDKITGRTLDAQLKEQIIKLTGGHGKLARICYETLLANDGDLPKDIPSFLLESATLKGGLFELWNYLTPTEQSIVQEHLINPVDHPTHIESVETFLQKIGLLKSDGKLGVPLLEPYIETLPAHNTEEIHYDSDKNEITQGRDTITDKLSPSEFRLLRFLIQNKERVCERDELIQVIWKDTATQEGVTDQALDQIIYRLRKKIEHDPNNPTHLQTIKGKGIRFIP